jgi:hypothetical protein
MDNSELLVNIDQKVDKIQEKLHDHEIILTKQEMNLQEHIRRSLYNEEQVDILKNEVKPVLQGLSFLKTVGKFSIWLGGVLYAVAKLIK